MQFQSLMVKDIGVGFVWGFALSIPGAPCLSYRANPRAEIGAAGGSGLFRACCVYRALPVEERKRGVWKALVTDLGMQMRDWGLDPFVAERERAVLPKAFQGRREAG